MYSIEEIKSMNSKPAPAPPKRRCSVCNVKSAEGPAKAVIIHSASNRDTKYIDFSSEFRREFFRRVCGSYGVSLDSGLIDWGSADPDSLDKVVESYWGYFPQPDQETTPGYDEA